MCTYDCMLLASQPQVHIDRKRLPLAEDVSVEGIATATTGFTGADLANLVNEAALLAGRNSRNQVSMREFNEAILRAVAGIEKKRSLVKGLEKDVVAKHEVRHLPFTDPNMDHESVGLVDCRQQRTRKRVFLTCCWM